MRTIASAVATVAIFAGTTACGGSGFPAISPAEARHLHAYDIISHSMEDTLRPGDVVTADDSIPVRRGSIVVFLGPAGWSDGPAKKFIYRVIAVGGDHLNCCDENGNLVLNGEPLHETYLFGGSSTFPASKPSNFPFDVTVPAGRLFVMGDHRDTNADSRVHSEDGNHGTIPVANVIGVVTRIVKPLGRVRLLPAHT